MKPVYSDPLPDGWTENALRSLTVRRRGYSWAKDQEVLSAEPGAVPVIRIPNVRERLDLSDLLYLRGVSDEDICEFAVERDWILFVASNGNPDRIGDAVLIESDQPMVFASFLQGITTDEPARLLPAFLARWMQLDSVHQTFSKTSQKTTGLANFSWSAVKNKPMRYPSDVREQQAILDLLATAETAIDAVQSELCSIERLRASLLHTLFLKGHVGANEPFREVSLLRRTYEIPAHWQFARIGQYLTSVDYGTNAPSNDDMVGWPVVAIPQILDPVLKRGDWPYSAIPQEEADQLRLAKDDVLLIRTNGNPDYIGKATVVPEDVAAEHVVFASYLIRARPDPDHLLGTYLNLFLASPLGRRQLIAVANTSAGNHNLGARSLKRMLIPLPPPEEQAEIVRELSAVQALRESLASRVASLEELRFSMLENLLTGRVRVPTPAHA